MKFTLLLCTVNRERLLQRCLDSLLSQTVENYEIIIVDQSDNENRTLTNSNIIKYIHIDQKGLSHARNVGLRIATGDYVCLIDDDAIYNQNYLKTASEFIESTGAAIISGKIVDPDTGEYYLKRTKTDRVYNISYLTSMAYCASASMIIRRDLLVDGFDEDFGVGALYGSGEESDIIFRTLDKKEKIMFCPDLLLWHKAPERDATDEKLYRYGVGTGALFKKHYLESNKMRYFCLFMISLGRSIFGSLLYSLGRKEHRKSKILRKGKIKGFDEYKKCKA